MDEGALQGLRGTWRVPWSMGKVRAGMQREEKSISLDSTKVLPWIRCHCTALCTDLEFNKPTQMATLYLNYYFGSSTTLSRVGILPYPGLKPTQPIQTLKCRGPPRNPKYSKPQKKKRNQKCKMRGTPPQPPVLNPQKKPKHSCSHTAHQQTKKVSGSRVQLYPTVFEFLASMYPGTRVQQASTIVVKH